MSDLNVEIMSFESFLAEDAKALSDANHHKKTGDAAADEVVEPSEHKLDQKGIKTADSRQAAINAKAGTLGVKEKLNEAEDIKGDRLVGDKKDKIKEKDNDDDDDDKKGGDDKVIDRDDDEDRDDKKRKSDEEE